MSSASPMTGFDIVAANRTNRAFHACWDERITELFDARSKAIEDLRGLASQPKRVAMNRASALLKTIVESEKKLANFHQDFEPFTPHDLFEEQRA